VSLALIGGHGTVVVGLDRRARTDEDPLGPQALRDAQRGMTLAAGLGLPLLTILDTSGATLSKEAEEGGLGREIARSLAQMLSLPVPTVTLLLGEGAGGGALALFPADRIIATANSWLAPLPPEGASAIVHGTTGRAADMARRQRIAAHELLSDGIVDEVTAEDAQAGPVRFCHDAAGAVAASLAALTRSDPERLLAERTGRYCRIGTLEAAGSREPAAG
jgi:acyl-CoA carboxylase subunit beta